MIVILEDLQGNYILMLVLITPYAFKAELIRTRVFNFCSIIRVGGTFGCYFNELHVFA